MPNGNPLPVKDVYHIRTVTDAANGQDEEREEARKKVQLIERELNDLTCLITTDSGVRHAETAIKLF